MPDSPSIGSPGNCAQCGAPMRAAASFCTACGAPAAAPAPAGRAQRSKRWMAVGAGALLLALAAGALIALNGAQQGASTAPVAVPTAPMANQDIPYPDVARVSPEQAHISAMSGDAVIVDVRGQEFYDQGHARGAISIPLEELPARMGELPKDKAILLYCT